MHRGTNLGRRSVNVRDDAIDVALTSHYADNPRDSSRSPSLLPVKGCAYSKLSARFSPQFHLVIR